MKTFHLILYFNVFKDAINEKNLVTELGAGCVKTQQLFLKMMLIII